MPKIEIALSPKLIRNIRLDSDVSAIPIIVFSNPHLGGLTHAAVEAGATKSLAKLDLVGTRVTHIGVAALRKARPALELHLNNGLELSLHEQ